MQRTETLFVAINNINLRMVYPGPIMVTGIIRAFAGNSQKSLKFITLGQGVLKSA